jgi:hypothetical protein
MELWIRSQDKMNLVKIRQVGINYQNNKQIIANYIPELYENSREFFELLGTYKTKERALEVLDEIQNIFSLNIKNMSYNEADLFLKAKMLDSCYEMPKE